MYPMIRSQVPLFLGLRLVFCLSISVVRNKTILYFKNQGSMGSLGQAFKIIHILAVGIDL